jgi:hypothetical protein
MSENEKTLQEEVTDNARQVRAEMLAFNQAQLVKQCETLTEQAKQLHPALAVSRRLHDAVTEATRSLAGLVGAYTHYPDHNDQEIPF